MRKPPVKHVTCLVINPNSSRVMTEGLDDLVAKLGYGEETRVVTYTAPAGPASINNEDDATESAKICLPDLEKHLDKYDGFIVACYSVHPLVEMLRDRLRSNPVPTTGIFEASIGTALSFLATARSNAAAHTVDKFGIVSTGKYWEQALTDGVLHYLGVNQPTDCKRFKGVETTGLTAGELHTAPAAEVRKRLADATKRLVKDGDVSAICLGCAGMAGMDEIVAAACVEELGAEMGARVKIIDGVKSAIALVEGMMRA